MTPTGSSSSSSTGTPPPTIALILPSSGELPGLDQTALLLSPGHRKPDPEDLYCRPEHQSDRGAERAALVVEIRSKGDESYEKIGFYAELGVHEMLIVHPEDRWVELLRAVGGRLLPVSADAHGTVRSEVLGAQFAAAEGQLRITWQDGAAEI